MTRLILLRLKARLRDALKPISEAAVGGITITLLRVTRLFDPDKGETRSLRSKEEANDYRYFPDPDLLPVVIEKDFIESVRGTLPELPDQKAARYIEKFGLSAYDAGVLTASREMGDYYEGVLAALKSKNLEGNEKLAANWTMGELSAALNKDGVEVTESVLARRAAEELQHRAEAARAEAEALEQLNALLDEIVRLYVRSDVPFGAFLSGGVDWSRQGASSQADGQSGSAGLSPRTVSRQYP